MNVKLRIRVQGFALVEALIAFVVVAAGLLALAPLYSDMMGGSSLAKARAEALEAARGQNELLRNYALKAQFDLDLVNGTRSWTGKNADFTMAWTVTAPTGTNPPKYKNVTTSVTWTDPKDGAQTVTLPTRILFNDPALSAGIQDRALCQTDPARCRGLDSPWTSGYEGPHLSTADQTQIGSTVVDNQGTSRTSDDVSIKTYDGGNVEVIHDGTVQFTAFGGVVHRIRGRIWLTAGARSVLEATRRSNALAVIASSPAWCLFPICDGPGETCEMVDTSGQRNVSWRIASYVCYVSGDCTKGGAGCVSGFNDSFASKRLNGGWYGSVGNFSVFLDPDDAVCTMDTNIAGGDDLRLTPSRQYASYRVSDSGAPASCTNPLNGLLSAVETRLDPWPDGRYNDFQPDQDQPHGPIERDKTRTFSGFCVSGSPKATPSTEGINASFAYQDFVIGNRTEINSEGCTAIAAKTRNAFIRDTFCSLRATDGFIQALPPSTIGRALNLDSLNKSVPENQSYGGPCP